MGNPDLNRFHRGLKFILVNSAQMRVLLFSDLSWQEFLKRVGLSPMMGVSMMVDIIMYYGRCDLCL